MANEQISVRIDHATKAAAENVFNILGLSATDAVRMFYRRVALERGLPFPVKIPNAETIKAIREADAGKGKRMSYEEFHDYLTKISRGKISK